MKFQSIARHLEIQAFPSFYIGDFNLFKVSNIIYHF